MNETNTNTDNEFLPIGTVIAVCQYVLKRLYLILAAALIEGVAMFAVVVCFLVLFV